MMRKDTIYCIRTTRKLKKKKRLRKQSFLFALFDYRAIRENKPYFYLTIKSFCNFFIIFLFPFTDFYTLVESVWRCIQCASKRCLRHISLSQRHAQLLIKCHLYHLTINIQEFLYDVNKKMDNTQENIRVFLDIIQFFLYNILVGQGV